MKRKLIRFIENDIGREKDDKYYVVIDADINQNKQSQIDKAKEEQTLSDCKKE